MDKREARKQYKLRKTPKGVFAVRCPAAGSAWAGASNHLDTEKNGLWFQLKQGSHLNRVLQAAWNAHGEAAFRFEVLETLDDDVNPLLVKDALRERLEHWAKELGARI